ncbi:ImmA/IrrE family metallo-endopeptidase [Pseudomonas aeruginosa]|uniref:ImmA/IrrE family metallo-endopeptidase n=1 Tax=Pseudomonas aeruginosa TaxID=287 RepID=UPI000EADA8E8|nr:ImmA/IrrE family metallo-endopeptidase [Pseudomonas aeruginosa]HCF1961852.1 ImmA/IrrE family metallo-endopeptidase [Pseudomonas aeruginosa]HCI1969339.1 ImmA/IrrE family metallo-endopeptidase [Pseudomonas aeruginosa]
MDTKVIRTEEQHTAYLEEISRLIEMMPTPGSPESDRLELLTVLVESYEDKKHPVEAPDPIDAILFRMHEKGYKQADLIPYFGTRSRVSEVLGRKRPLTVPMIRALSVGLGISAETLIGVASSEATTSKEDVDWSKFPVKEMVARGWIQKIVGKAARSTEETVKDFISQIGWGVGSAAFKRTPLGDAYSPATKYSLYAWLVRVIQKARERKGRIGEFDESVLSSAFLKDLAQLSWSERGPLLAVEFLEKNGIIVVIEPHLKGTMLDGAALKDSDGTPVIALTLRHDRLDNFWFTLLHEVAHIWKHIGREETFLDDLDASSDDRREAEANRLAREAFIPRISWKRSDAYLSPTRENIDKLSRELKIHPSIIVGRIQRESENYQVFTDMLGRGEVRKLLLDTSEGV